jgi:predicted transcriptional regulator with HTH domain
MSVLNEAIDQYLAEAYPKGHVSADIERAAMANPAAFRAKTNPD